jgi:phosphoglycolate phosphatase
MTDGEAVPLMSAGNLVKPRAVLLDWDNTLIDSWLAIHDAQNHTLTHFNLPPWTMEETRRRVRGSMRDSYPALFGDRWREAGEIFYARFSAKHKETLAPLPGAAQLLEDLYEAGVYLAIVSNKKGSYLREEVAHLGWQRFFGRIVGAFDAKRDKPASEPVHMALDGSGIGCGRDVWLAGDADIDLECAANAGVVPVLVRQQPPQTGEFENHPPHMHVDGCITLSQIIRSL